MAKCTYRKRPADEALCPMLADPGHVLCPRHAFLTEMKADKRLAKEQARGHVAKGPAPRDRKGMIRAGYQFTGTGHCEGCNQLVEWWLTPLKRKAPYNKMSSDAAPVVSHFATCPRASSWRRSA